MRPITDYLHNLDLVIDKTIYFDQYIGIIKGYEYDYLIIDFVKGASYKGYRLSIAEWSKQIMVEGNLVRRYGDL